jgi:hypothetical protein
MHLIHSLYEMANLRPPFHANDMFVIKLGMDFIKKFAVGYMSLLIKNIQKI